MRPGWIIALIITAATSSLQAQAPTAEELTFFDQKIDGLMVQHCYACHSVAAHDAKKLKGELYLDSAAGMLAGGETGPAIVKGKSAESLIIKALKYDGVKIGG